MALVLAIDPAFKHHDVLQRLADDLAGHEIVFAPSCDEALSTIGRQIPDLVVFPLCCSESDATVIASRVRAQSPANLFRTLAIPLLAVGVNETALTPVQWFYWFKPRDESTLARPRDPRAFADQIRGYLATATGDSAGQEWEHPASGRKPLPARVAAAASVVAEAAWTMLSGLASTAAPHLSRLSKGVPPPRWVRSLAAAVVLAVAAATVSGLLIRRADWFTAAQEPAPATAEKRPAARGVATPAQGTKTSTTRKTGRLRVTSSPEGALVTIDGRRRGVTPLLLEDLPVGSHSVTLQSKGGVIQRSVDVRADEIATLEVLIYSGWLAIFSPFELEILAGGRVLQFDDRHQTMLPAGRHEIEFVNHALSYRGSRVVDVKPGEVTTLSIVPPRTTLTLNTTPAADVWLDGAHVGTAPVIDVPLDLGTHEIILRHPTAGERRRTIIATSAPLRLDIDFGSQD